MERTAFPAIIGLWCAGLGAAAQFGKVSVTFPMLADIYGGAGAALGFAVSLVGFVGVLFGVTAGLIVARFGPRRSLVTALGLGALVSAFQATLPVLPLFLASRVVEGASHLAIVVAAPTLIARLSADRHRGLTLSLWSTFFGVAFAVLASAGLPLARSHGVGALYAAHAGWMAAMAALILVLLPRDVIGPRADRRQGGLLQDHLDIYRSPYMNAAALGWVCYAGAFVAILTVMPSFLDETHRAGVTGLMPLAGIASSMTLGVWLLRRVPAVRVAIAGFGLSLLASIALWAWPAAPWTYFLLAAALGLVQGSSFAAIPQLNADPGDQARANGALAQMGNVGTTCGTPLLVALTGAAGIGGFLLFAGMLFGGGMAMHLLTARLRGSH